MRSADNREQTEHSELWDIDVFGLLSQLWKGKKTILSIMIVMLCIAVGYLFFQKPRWSSTAVVSPPQTGQVADYTNTLLLLYPMASADNGVSSTLLPAIYDIRASVFERFSALLSARIATGTKDAVTTEALKMTLPQARAAGAGAASSFPIQLSYIAQSPEQLETAFRAFIEQIDSEVEKQLISDLQKNIEVRKQELAASLVIQSRLAKEQLQQRLDALSEAASKMKGREGAETLSLVIKNDADSQLNYANEAFKTREQLLQLESIEPEKMRVSTFHYVLEPGVPQIVAKKPAILVILLALISGFIIGSGIVLARNAVCSYQRR